MLEPDSMRGVPLDMDQYTRLFGTARIPTEVRSRLGCPFLEGSQADALPIPREAAKWRCTRIRATSSSSGVDNFVSAPGSTLSVLGRGRGFDQDRRASLLFSFSRRSGNVILIDRL